MEQYANRNGNSPIPYYQIENYKIVVWFKGGRSFFFSYRKVGRKHVDVMKSLVLNGAELSAYIKKKCKI